ncbi:HipA domain-containing protein [Ferrovum myxofaciens]|jgi:serine/threonine-protein kinase HipA|uniref:HipA domain-containing protein n=2 Tax=root TaxID=1 RepID=A0A8F3E0H3_9PROT|nr:HipA domain-containing protein [Ferrovum myxofaciens]MBW8028271.1 type II toxin-antitoxin system HipA family toxin [Ferrovum sp.]KXW59368.1 serine/threonine-protein kinase HipA [Ferrovum myxofaciens]MBU6994296.1 HipA domain-containing protein [Ferrovum myxofaciens]NDU86605.1 type II toxin-antitoxin system HipA family toxin [Ferrovum sp.]QKE38190.1 MAG: HipA domain-containing protein [Ferrovum myxofaciens]
MTYVLDIYDRDIIVGAVRFDPQTDTFTFDYDDGWLAGKHAYALSPAFPLRGANNQTGSFGNIRRFIENLLPEGQALDIVARAERVTKSNIYGLIRAIGRETTGALSFLPEGEMPGPDNESLREIKETELRERIAERAQVPLAIWDGKVRLSIAGYQDKLPVYLADDRMYLANSRFASTHILKPEPVTPDMAGLVVNEHYCMRLAAVLRLEVAHVEIRRLPDPVLVVERFDRQRTADGVRRIHIIDTCQALDLPVSFKYERNLGSGRDVRNIREGINFERLFSVVQHASNKATIRLALLRWALFQFLIGNSDAHGKNVSFYSRPEGLALAPFYDLVSVVQFPAVDHELAMAFGDEFDLDAVAPYDVADFAKRTRMPRSLLAREMRNMARAARSSVGPLADDPVYRVSEQATVQKLKDFVLSQAMRLEEMVEPMLAVREDDL